MGLINPSLPVIGNPNSSEDPKVLSALSAIVSAINGNLDGANLADGSVGYADLASATQNAFLKLLNAADRKLNFGNGSVTLNGVANRSAGQTTFAHSLGVTPALVIVSGKGTIGITEDAVSHPAKFTAASADATNITVIGEAPGTSSNVATFYWAAIS